MADGLTIQRSSERALKKESAPFPLDLSATDREASHAFRALAEVEGIIPALESAHAIAEVMRLAPRLRKNQLIIVNLSGRGDKDMGSVGDHLGV